MALSSRTRLNFALLALVALLGAFAYFRPGLKRAVPAPPVAVAAMGLQDVRIALAGKPEVHLVRKGTDWRMRAPLDFPADAALMQGLLDSLAAPLESGFPAAGADLAKYGLDKPLARLWLDGEEYAFGALQPVSKQRYVLHGGGVHLVDDYVFYRIAHDSYWWLDKRLVPEGTRITGLQLPRATITRDTEGHWQLAPANKAVTPENIQTLVDAWQDAYAMGMAPIGKGKRLGEVALGLAGTKEPLRFLILDDPDYLILARPDLGLEYQVDISRNDALLSPGAEP